MQSLEEEKLMLLSSGYSIWAGLRLEAMSVAERYGLRGLFNSATGTD